MSRPVPAPLPAMDGGPRSVTPTPTANTVPVPPELVCLGLSLGTVPLEQLESAAVHLSPTCLESYFEASTHIREAAILRTCHRVEVYLWTEQPEAALSNAERLLPPGLAWGVRRKEEAVRHLYRVTAGLESMAVGEREVREQVRVAARHVLSRAPRPVLRPLLLAAVDAADRAAPVVPMSRSIAALGAAHVLEESPVPFPRVLVVGSGHAGRQLAELLAPSCRVTILYRSHPPDARFLRIAGVRASAWNTLGEEVAVSDVVVTAAKSGERIIDPALVEGRASPLLLIDLGVPRNVDPAVTGVPRVRLIDLEGLRPLDPVPPPPEHEASIERAANAAAESVRASGLEVWVDRYRRRVESVRRALLDGSRQDLGPLSADQEAALDRLTRQLVARLVEGPTRGLRAISSGPEGDAWREWALKWLAPPSTRP